MQLSWRWLTMFKVYFDDSGSEENIAFAVAGYVSSVEQWKKFDQEWDKILSDYGISVFHMREFTQSKGEFIGLEGQDDDRKRLLERLIGTIKVRVQKSFGCIVNPRDFEATNQKYLLKEALGNIYAFCGRYCAGHVRQWANKHNYPMQDIIFFFESGTKGRGDLINRMDRDGFRKPEFGGKELPPLQAADFISWELRKHADLAFDRKLKGFRKSFEKLAEIPQDWGIYVNQQAIENFCEDASICKRQP